MFTPYHTINYATTSCEYPVLNRIQGMPTFSTLTHLKKQMKANTQTVTSDLVGGARHGHLDLVLLPSKYALVGDELYNLPVHPGTLTIPNNVDAAEVVQRRDSHHQQIRKFRELVEKKSTYP